MAKIRGSRLLLATAAIALLASTQAFADSYARIVRLSDVDGTVEIDRNTGNGFEKALMNMPITQGVRLKTGIAGRAEVEFENGSVIRLVGDSAVDFTALSLRSNGERVSEMQIDDGTVYVDFRHKGNDEFRVTVGNRSLDLTKDVRFRARMDRGEAELAVFKGDLEVQGDGQTAKIKKNETFTLNLNDGAQYVLAKGITTLDTDNYDHERTQYLEQYASSSHGSPYAYGYSDLYRYGSFFDVPGYGLVWQPTSVGLGWDPYSSGYWSYYPGSGYVWVSSYPWGWAPYRYGQWMFLSGRGWVWHPGGWNNWNRGVAVTNPPPAWHHPTPPPATGGGATVPVGNPVPPRRPVIQTDDMPRRLPAGKMDPTGRTDKFGGRPNAHTGTATTPPVNSAVAPTTTTTAPATAQPQPARPANPGGASTNKGTRDFGTERGRPPQHAPSSGSPKSAAPPRMQSPQMHSAPMHSAPAPRPAPAKKG